MSVAENPRHVVHARIFFHHTVSTTGWTEKTPWMMDLNFPPKFILSLSKRVEYAIICGKLQPNEGPHMRYSAAIILFVSTIGCTETSTNVVTVDSGLSIDSAVDELASISARLSEHRDDLEHLPQQIIMVRSERINCLERLQRLDTEFREAKIHTPLLRDEVESELTATQAALSLRRQELWKEGVEKIQTERSMRDEKRKRVGARASSREEAIWVSAAKDKLEIEIARWYMHELSTAQAERVNKVAAHDATLLALGNESTALKQKCMRLEDAIACTEEHLAILPSLINDLNARSDELRLQLQMLIDQKATLEDQQRIARLEREAAHQRRLEVANARHTALLAELVARRTQRREKRIGWNSEIYTSEANRNYVPDPGVHRVRAYCRSDGTRVRSHWRTNPDEFIENNLGYR